MPAFLKLPVNAATLMPAFLVMPANAATKMPAFLIMPAIAGNFRIKSFNLLSSYPKIF